VISAPPLADGREHYEASTVSGFQPLGLAATGDLTVDLASEALAVYDYASISGGRSSVGALRRPGRG
jgi:hypothetical protein